MNTLVLRHFGSLPLTSQGAPLRIRALRDRLAMHQAESEERAKQQSRCEASNLATEIRGSAFLRSKKPKREFLPILQRESESTFTFFDRLGLRTSLASKITQHFRL